MKNWFRLLVCLSVLACFAATALPTEAFARTHHSHHSSKKKHSRHKASKHNAAAAQLREAQISLANLGYYHGAPDGKLGPKTQKAIRSFQREHGLRVTGKLDTKTSAALSRADSKRAMTALPLPMPREGQRIAHGDFYGETHQDYADPMYGSAVVAGSKAEGQYARTQGIVSRYAKLDVNENVNGPVRRYQITLNGAPVLQINDQPSVIGLSQTYQLTNEDVIILTSYRPDDTVCTYKHFLLTMSATRSLLLPIENCTHGYQARLTNNALFITFPEVDDQRNVGATFRYEPAEQLVKL